MSSLYLYAEVVRRLMRAIQHLSVRDADGVAQALIFLETGDYADQELCIQLDRLREAVQSAGDGGDVMEAIDDLAACAERLIGLHFAKPDFGPRQFAIADLDQLTDSDPHS